MKYQELIEKAEKNQDYWKAEIIRRFKIYVETQDALRNNPMSFSSVHHPKNPKYPEFKKQSEEAQQAYSNLWMATDMEYAEDGFRNFMWEWRYWKVMARKCCWYQKSIFTDYMASKTMLNLQRAETNFAKVCGLSENYKPSSYYIEKAFPNLKLSK